jgi:hypothetical protein
MRSTMLGSTDIAVVFVDGGDVGSATFGAGDEGLGALAIGAGVTEAKATAALKEGGSVLKGADRCLAAEEVGGRAFHELKAVPIGIVEREDNAGVYFPSKVFFTPEPSRLGE